MHSRKKVVGTVAAVAVLGATGVGVAQSVGDGVEFEAASAELSYQERSRTDRPCRNSRDGDFVRFSRFTGRATSEDRELDGELELLTATLIEGNAAADGDGAITVGQARVLNRGENAGTSRDDILTRFGLAAVDQNNGQDGEDDRPVTDNPPALPVPGQGPRREQDDNDERDFFVEGFGLGRATGASSRALLSNLNLDVAADEPRGTAREEDRTRTGQVDTGTDAGNDGLLASGTCDLDGDRDDDFDEGSAFGGSGGRD